MKKIDLSVLDYWRKVSLERFMLHPLEERLSIACMMLSRDEYKDLLSKIGIVQARKRSGGDLL